MTVPPVLRASRSRSSRAAAWKATPAKRGCGPRRITRHAALACRPRSSSVSGVRSATVKPKSVPNRSARSRSGLSNSSHASPATLTRGLPDRPGCSPGRAPVSLCSERCGSSPERSGGGPAVPAGFSCVVMVASSPSTNEGIDHSCDPSSVMTKVLSSAGLTEISTLGRWRGERDCHAEVTQHVPDRARHPGPGRRGHRAGLARVTVPALVILFTVYAFIAAGLQSARASAVPRPGRSSGTCCSGWST